MHSPHQPITIIIIRQIYLSFFFVVHLFIYLFPLFLLECLQHCLTKRKMQLAVIHLLWPLIWCRLLTRQLVLLTADHPQCNNSSLDQCTSALISPWWVNQCLAPQFTAVQAALTPIQAQQVEHIHPKRWLQNPSCCLQSTQPFRCPFATLTTVVALAVSLMPLEIAWTDLLNANFIIIFTSS